MVIILNFSDHGIGLNGASWTGSVQSTIAATLVLTDLLKYLIKIHRLQINKMNIKIKLALLISEALDLELQIVLYCIIW